MQPNVRRHILGIPFSCRVAHVVEKKTPGFSFLQYFRGLWFDLMPLLPPKLLLLLKKL